MCWDGLSHKAQTALSEAIAVATERGHCEIISLHILRALLDREDSVLIGILNHVGSQHEQVRAALEEAMNHVPRPERPPETISMSEELDALISRGWNVAQRLGDTRLDAAHLLLSMVDSHTDLGGAILREQRVSVLMLTCFVLQWRQTQGHDRAWGG